MEEVFTLLLTVFVVYLIYKHGEYKKLTSSHPCKIIYKIKEEKNEI
tara:strand:- start:1159 stop:1296 length:138 start_codon:yes stop_codon:yes gene_type:complete